MSIWLNCTQCGAQFKLANSMAGKWFKCGKCHNVLAVPSAAPKDDLLPPDPPQPPPAPAEPITLSLAPSPREVARAARARGDVISDPTRGFWSDALCSFTVHFRGMGICFFVIAAVMYLIYGFLGFAGVFGLPGRFIVTGWLCAYYLGIIGETAGGEDILPRFTMENGMWEDVLRPYLLFLGTFLWVALPCIVSMAVRLLLGRDLMSPEDMLLSGAFVALAVFLWPMALLSVSLHGFTLDVLRYDVQLATIGRSFPQYLATCAMLAVTVAGHIGSTMVLSPRGGVIVAVIEGSMLLYALSTVLTAALQAYFAIAAMRVIGLFYRHNKRHFAWEAE